MNSGVIPILKISSIGVTLDPASISIDEKGQIQIANAQVLQAILSARPKSDVAGLRPQLDDEQNALNCNQSACNAASCGGK